MTPTTPTTDYAETAGGAAGANATVPLSVWQRLVPRLDAARDWGMGIFLIVLFIVLAVSSGAFLSTANLKNVVDQSVASGLVACAGAVVIIAGGFDLSAGGIAAVCSIVVAQAVNADGIVLGTIIALALGCALGLGNGLLITVGRVSPFVATLGTSIMLGGFSVALSNGALILVNNAGFGDIATTQIFGINSSTYVLAVFAILCWFVLTQTVLGRQIFATGDNHAAARTAGIPVARVLILVYVLSGFAAAIAGVIVVSRSNSVTGSNGLDLMFTALAAMLVGGNVAGRGGIGRTLIGVFILALIGNGFDLLGLNPYYENVVQGGIIVVAVTAEVWAAQSRRS